MPPEPLFLIRDAQLDAIAEAMSEDFRRYITGHLRESFPQWAAGRDLDRFVRKALQRARAHRIDGGADLGTFVTLCVVLGEEFDTEREWAARAFADEAVKDPAGRLARVVAMARDLAES